MNIQGTLLQKGEEFLPGEFISKDCEINMDKAFKTPVTWHFNHANPIGQLISLESNEKNNCLLVDIELNEVNVIKLNIFKRFVNYFVKFLGFKPIFKEHEDIFKKFLKEYYSFGYGGIVLERNGNQITKFDLKEVSLISNRK